jgi:hypothetical protein
MESLGRACNDNDKVLGVSVEVKAGVIVESFVEEGCFLVGNLVGFEGASVRVVGTVDGALGWSVGCRGRLVTVRGAFVGDRVWGRRVVFVAWKAATGAITSGIGDGISADGEREAGSFTLGSPTPLESTVGDIVVASDATGTTVRPRTLVVGVAAAAAGIGTATGKLAGTRCCWGSCADSAAAVWLPLCRDPLLGTNSMRVAINAAATTTKSSVAKAMLVQ